MSIPKKLSVLSPEQMVELDALLLDGQPASKIAEMIQNTWGLLTEDKTASVKKMLERYRSKDLRHKTVQAIAEKVTGIHLGGITKKLNAVEELSALTAIQKTRFEKAYGTEAKAPLLMKTVSEEAKLFKDMLVELGKLQLETGIIQRAPKKLTGSIVGEDGEVKQFEWTAEQEQLFREVEAFENNGVFEVG